jgi:hypothetical protein
MRPEHKRIFTLLATWQLMGLCIEREASGEPQEGRIAVGTVILERVDHRKWDGNTIQEVILWPWQFSWTMPEAGEDYYEEAVRIATDWVGSYAKDEALQECAAIALGMLQGTISRDPDLAAVNCCQYLNPKTAGKTREKWIKAGMTPIKVIAHHEFFKEG